jgi:hypothetical protein
MMTRPSSARSNPAMIRNKVDLPQPDGPSRIVKDPSSTFKSMPWRTLVFLLNVFLIPSSTILLIVFSFVYQSAVEQVNLRVGETE